MHRHEVPVSEVAIGLPPRPGHCLGDDGDQVTRSLFVLFCLVGASAHAEYSNTSAQITCPTSDRTMEFRAVTNWNEPALWAAAPEEERTAFFAAAKRHNIYYEGDYDVECVLEAYRVRVWGWMGFVSDRVECGGDPGGVISLSVDGAVVIRQVLFGNSCMTSVWSGSLRMTTVGAPYGASLLVCARGPNQSDEEPRCQTFPLTGNTSSASNVFAERELQKLAEDPHRKPK